jgi:hypothetical protein
MINSKLSPAKWFMLAALCIALSAAGIWAFARKRQPAKSMQEMTFRAVNNTNGLTVTGFEKTSDGSHIRVTLRNDSAERITAYAVAFGGLRIISDLAYTGAPFLPGQSRSEEILYDNFAAAAMRNPDEAGVLNVVAVYFVNRGEGEPDIVQTISERHQGLKDQLALALPSLRTELSGPQQAESFSADTLEALSLRLKSSAPKSSTSRDYNEGRAWVTRLLDDDITQAKNGRGLTLGAVSKEELNRLVLLYEKMQAQL